MFVVSPGCVLIDGLSAHCKFVNGLFKLYVAHFLSSFHAGHEDFEEIINWLPSSVIILFADSQKFGCDELISKSSSCNSNVLIASTISKLFICCSYNINISRNMT